MIGKLVLKQPLLHLSGRLQGGIPSCLQLSRDQTIVRVDRLITTSGQAYFILRLFPFQGEHTMALPLLFGNPCCHFQSRRASLNGLGELLLLAEVVVLLLLPLLLPLLAASLGSSHVDGSPDSTASIRRRK